MKNYFECCNHCTKRKVGCHGKCKEFKDAKTANDERNNNIKRYKKEYEDLIGYSIETHQRFEKNNREKFYVRYV